jgi:hypothetical protein
MADVMEDLAAADQQGSPTAAVASALGLGDPSRSADDAHRLVSRQQFVAHVDACVRYLAASLDDMHAPDPAEASTAESARRDLWQWLQAPGSVLDDGTPLDFILFDAVIQRVGERLPRRGAAAHRDVTRAAWMFAEMTHAIRPVAGFPAALAAAP